MLVESYAGVDGSTCADGGLGAGSEEEAKGFEIGLFVSIEAASGILTFVLVVGGMSRLFIWRNQPQQPHNLCRISDFGIFDVVPASEH